MANLQHRHISTTGLCEQCMTELEDTLHALWACSKLEEVWRTLSWTLLAAQARPLSFNTLLDCFLQVKDDFRKEIFIMTVWKICNRQNALKFGRPAISVTNIIPRAGALLQEFMSTQESPDEPPSIAISSQWHPPEFPYYKANFDAAVFKASSSAGIGVIIRDSRGEAIGALSVPTPLFTSVVVMEALACKRAVLFAKEIGLRQVIFEGDSAVVIQAVIQGNSASAEYGNIIEDIRILATDFDFIHFNLFKCNCNVVADDLAKKAKDLLDLVVWLEDVPEDISPLLLFDVP